VRVTQERERERGERRPISEASGKNLNHSIPIMHKGGKKMTCKHSSCKCQAAEGKNGYCSDACANGKMVGTRCGCGHPPCK